MMSLGVVAIQSDRAAIIVLASRPIEIVLVLDAGQRGVSLGEGIVQLQGFLNGRLGLRHHFIGWKIPVFAVAVGVGEPCVRQASWESLRAGRSRST